MSALIAIAATIAAGLLVQFVGERLVDWVCRAKE